MRNEKKWIKICEWMDAEPLVGQDTREKICKKYELNDNISNSRLLIYQIAFEEGLHPETVRRHWRDFKKNRYAKYKVEILNIAKPKDQMNTFERVHIFEKIKEMHERSQVSISELCKNNGITRSDYYYWLRHPKLHSRINKSVSIEDALAIIGVYTDFPDYGIKKTYEALKSYTGFSYNFTRRCFKEIQIKKADTEEYEPLTGKRGAPCSRINNRQKEEVFKNGAPLIDIFPNFESHLNRTLDWNPISKINKNLHQKEERAKLLEQLQKSIYREGRTIEFKFKNQGYYTKRLIAEESTYPTIIVLGRLGSEGEQKSGYELFPIPYQSILETVTPKTIPADSGHLLYKTTIHKGRAKVIPIHETWGENYNNDKNFLISGRGLNKTTYDLESLRQIISNQTADSDNQNKSVELIDFSGLAEDSRIQLTSFKPTKEFEMNFWQMLFPDLLQLIKPNEDKKSDEKAGDPNSVINAIVKEYGISFYRLSEALIYDAVLQNLYVHTIERLKRKCKGLLNETYIRLSTTVTSCKKNKLIWCLKPTIDFFHNKCQEKIPIDKRCKDILLNNEKAHINQGIIFYDELSNENDFLFLMNLDWINRKTNCGDSIRAKLNVESDSPLGIITLHTLGSIVEKANNNYTPPLPDENLKKFVSYLEHGFSGICERIDCLFINETFPVITIRGIEESIEELKYQNTIPRKLSSVFKLSSAGE